MDKIDAAIRLLRSHGYALKIWTEDDVVEQFRQMPEWNQLSHEQRQQVVEETFGQKSWQYLEYVDESEYQTIYHSVREALAELGHIELQLDNHVNPLL